MDYQTLFNAAVGLSAVLIGWVLGRVTKSLDRLDEDVRRMPEKYVLKEDFTRALHEVKDTIENGFERIWNKLDNKADKP